jgi:hypothetical protein
MFEPHPMDQLESAIQAAAARALRRRASVQRERAALGTAAVDHGGKLVTIIASEARAALTLAEDFEEIAADLEGSSQ